MHELSIVINIIFIAEKEARKSGAKSINRIELNIGKLTSIEPMAFDTAWKCGINYGMLENAERIINYIDGKARCKDCGELFAYPEFATPCPKCSSYFSDIIEGKDLSIKSISVD